METIKADCSKATRWSLHSTSATNQTIQHTSCASRSWSKYRNGAFDT